MTSQLPPLPNVKQAVPFFMVANMERSVRFYVDGLGFTIKHRWIDAGRLRWCWLERGAAVMLQEAATPDHRSVPQGKVGEGVSIYFICDDALAVYREVTARGVKSTAKPSVGNHMWVVPFADPDGYRLLFESPTDAPEESELEE